MMNEKNPMEGAQEGVDDGEICPPVQDEVTVGEHGFQFSDDQKREIALRYAVDHYGGRSLQGDGVTPVTHKTIVETATAFHAFLKGAGQ